jgi:hypothetical protein
MFYAIITICLLAAGICDMDHSIWTTISDPVFNSIDDCHMEALNYLHNIDFTNILEEGKSYMINVECMGNV